MQEHDEAVIMREHAISSTGDLPGKDGKADKRDLKGIPSMSEVPPQEQSAAEMWFQVAALLMHMMGTDHVEITPEIIHAFGRRNAAVTISFHADKGIRVSLMAIEEIKRLNAMRAV